MPHTTQPGWRNATLLASVAVAALLALVTTWTAALARVPQQRAAVERLLRAQTGLDVRYGRLVVRLGFYGPEAEFSDLEMRRAGADAPLLRAPRMVARFESWRLLRGGQLRPGRVLVSGADIDLRQLATLRREATLPGSRMTPPRTLGPANAAAGDARTVGDATLLGQLEARLPELLAGVPEGSLDFEAVTLVWTDPAGAAEPLQLRAPRLYASRRADGAQLSGTLLLPTRLGRTLFVTAQLRNAARGDGLDGRLRVSGRGLVLASWREFGWLPGAVTGGSGDVALSVQLRGGRVQQAEGQARLVGLGLSTPQPVVARRFGVAAGQFTFNRLPTALRYRLHQLELRPVGAEALALGERGSIEVTVDPRNGAGTLRGQRLPVEAAAMAVRVAIVADADGEGPSRAAPSLRVTGGDVLQLESRWGADGDAQDPVLRATLSGLQLASDDGAWRLDGLAATVAAAGARLQVTLVGRDLPLRAPWFEAPAEPVRVALSGTLDVATAPDGWSVAVPRLDLEFARGPALRLAGSAGVAGQGAASSAWLVSLAAPLARGDMALLESALRHWAPPGYWAGFTAGRLESASAELAGGALRSVEAQLRGASFAAAAGRPETTALDVDLAWDGQRLEGRMLRGQVGPLVLAGGRLSSLRSLRAGAPAEFAVEAQLNGALGEALRLAGVGALPGELPGMPARSTATGPPAAPALSGQARIDARLRIPATAAPGGGLALAIDVEDARWQPVAAAAPLAGLRGRLRADGRGLRDGRLEGRWLGGPVQLRLEGDGSAGLRLAASGRLPVAALEREWAWIDLVDRARDGELEWSADLRRDREDEGADEGARRSRTATARRAPREGDSPDDPPAWRLRVALPGSARADLRWLPGVADEVPWRIDRGIVTLGESPVVAGIPGALVVGGRLERLEMSGLAGAVARFGAGGGWQRPLVGEVAVDDLRLGDAALGGARLRLAGSRESTTVDLFGESLAGELRQVHEQPGRLQARFARLRLPAAIGVAALAESLLPMRTGLVLQVADLQRGRRSLGALDGLLESDGASVATRGLTLRRGAQRAVASGRCERATSACRAELQVADADLGALLQDLGAAPSLRGRDAALSGQLGWSMQPGVGFAASLQGALQLTATLEGELPVEAIARNRTDTVTGPAAGPGGDAPGGEDGERDAGIAGAPWPPLAPLLAVIARQRADSVAAAAGAPRAATAPGESPPTAAAFDGTRAAGGGPLPPRLAFERLELRLAIRDGIGEIERYEAIGREARLSLAGRFDFGRGTLEQQAQWYWIAPGVAGAVERLDPRSPLAATLRTLRDLLGARGAPTVAATRGAAIAGAPERFALSGASARPSVERLPQQDSTP